MTNKIIPIRLSHSSLETLLTCERKWQLDKLLVTDIARDETEHTVFGKAFGAGLATYLVTQNADKAIFQCWLAYWPHLETEKKSQARCIASLLASMPYLDTLLEDYEVVEFNGKPAVELSFRMNINESFYFVGHIDTILRNRFTGMHYVFECKTTGLELHDLAPLYQNSGQALGYSIALDRIAGEEQSSYGVIYFVAQIGRSWQPRVHVLPYEKTLTDRLNWFLTLGMDVQRLERMAEFNVYPRRGSACLTFNRPCKYFGICTLHGLDMPKAQEPDLINYDFTYELSELVEAHMGRITNRAA